MDYILNPIICTIWCSKAALNLVPEIPYAVWAVFFAMLFTLLNLRGIRATARTNEVLVLAMCVVVLYFFVAAVRYIMHQHGVSFTQPFYDPKTFSLGRISTGTSVAVLTYIGFDGISTLSEEAHNPRRNILLATVLTCLITGVLASAEVYAGQLIWPRLPQLSRCGHGILLRGRARRRTAALPRGEHDASGGDHRLRHGIATGRRPPALRHGARQHHSARLLRRHRAQARHTRAITCCS